VGGGGGGGIGCRVSSSSRLSSSTVQNTSFFRAVRALVSFSQHSLSASCYLCACCPFFFHSILLFMPSHTPHSCYTEPLAVPSLPFIVFSHAGDLIRMTIGGSVDHKFLGPLHCQHNPDAILLQFNAGQAHPSPAFSVSREHFVCAWV
jgi:hypothetical protein